MKGKTRFRPFHLFKNILGGKARRALGGRQPPCPVYSGSAVVDLISSIDRSAVTLWIFTWAISA